MVRWEKIWQDKLISRFQVIMHIMCMKLCDLSSEILLGAHLLEPIKWSAKAGGPLAGKFQSSLPAKLWQMQVIKNGITEIARIHQSACSGAKT